jgi:hypothetical protein
MHFVLVGLSIYRNTNRSYTIRSGSLMYNTCPSNISFKLLKTIEVHTGMQEQMILQVRMFGEPSRAYVTLVGPGTAVHVHVRLEVPRRRERLGAEAAFVGLFLGKDEKTG